MNQFAFANRSQLMTAHTAPRLIALFVALMVVITAATSHAITLTPDYFILVSLDGDANGVGTVDTGSMAGNTYVIRERDDLMD